ncbi:U3 small nucleolar RNA-associated protein NOL7 [Syngnathus scovelli]|uniref:U3 small nucleolar RNA-associated protein NOL7 n=1 Tax=Syngnathus scovelli TaxID=161590 RepID=UPI00210F5145|nr:nucleolar protein 7 [Syngnathus scovelli]XP_049603899.1 nucleolar protein 7 [Syngnathus scovelli]
MESWNLELSSSDDEAPEEVTFKDSKAQALRSVSQALESARREKELLKEKRKKRQELFQEQKKRKPLSDTLLEEIDSSQRQSQQEAEATHQDEDETEETKKQKLKHSKKLMGNYKVMTVKAQTLPSFHQKAAEDFLHMRYYKMASHRGTNNELLSLQNKTGKRKGAAFSFVNSQWAPEKKSKAEKLKRRWIQKRVSSS